MDIMIHSVTLDIIPSGYEGVKERPIAVETDTLSAIST